MVSVSHILDEQYFLDLSKTHQEKLAEIFTDPKHLNFTKLFLMEKNPEVYNLVAKTANKELGTGLVIVQTPSDTLSKIYQAEINGSRRKSDSSILNTI